MTDPRYHSLAAIVPFLIAATVFGIARIRPSRQTSACGAVLVCSAAIALFVGPWARAVGMTPLGGRENVSAGSRRRAVGRDRARARRRCRHRRRTSPARIFSAVATSTRFRCSGARPGSSWIDPTRGSSRATRRSSRTTPRSSRAFVGAAGSGSRLAPRVRSLGRGRLHERRSARVSARLRRDAGVLDPALRRSSAARRSTSRSRRTSFGDSQAADFHFNFYYAAEAIRAGENFYPPADFVVRGQDDLIIDYVYPPLVALLTVPWTLLPVGLAEVLFQFLLVAVFVATLVLLGVRDWRCYGLAFLWPPVTDAVATGNISILLGLAAAVVWVYRDRARVAGAALGVSIAAKVFLWPLTVWLAVTRRAASGRVERRRRGRRRSSSRGRSSGSAGFADYPDLVRRLTRSDGRALVLRVRARGRPRPAGGRRLGAVARDRVRRSRGAASSWRAGETSSARSSSRSRPRSRSRRSSGSTTSRSSSSPSRSRSRASRRSGSSGSRCRSSSTRASTTARRSRPRPSWSPRPSRSPSLSRPASWRSGARRATRPRGRRP